MDVQLKNIHRKIRYICRQYNSSSQSTTKRIVEGFQRRRSVENIVVVVVDKKIWILFGQVEFKNLKCLRVDIHKCN